MIEYVCECNAMQMGSRWKKAVVAESVRESLHSWCKRVKQRSKHDYYSTTRSVCSLESTIDERDEITVASGTLTRSSSMESLNQITVTSVDQLMIEDSKKKADEYLSRSIDFTLPPQDDHNDFENNGDDDDGEDKVETLLDLFHKT